MRAELELLDANGGDQVVREGVAGGLQVDLTHQVNHVVTLLVICCRVMSNAGRPLSLDPIVIIAAICLLYSVFLCSSMQYNDMTIFIMTLYTCRSKQHLHTL